MENEIVCFDIYIYVYIYIYCDRKADQRKVTGIEQLWSQNHREKNFLVNFIE